jgi:hypothetical protein
MTTASAPVLSLPELGPLARARLWLSYQRYGLLLCGSAALPVTIALLWPWLFWVWAPLALVMWKPVAFGVTVLGRWPRKLRATLVAEHRMRRGRFRPESVEAYCGDPCFRLVAHEILARAGMPAAERRALVARLRAEHEKSSRVLLLVDHATGTVFTVQDGRVESRAALSGPGVPAASRSGMGDSALIRPAPSASPDAALSS